MQALVYNGPGRKSLEERAQPTIQRPTDAVVRISKTTIGGTELRILKGEVLTCQPQTILGHEGIGVVEEVGPDIVNFKPGDRVLISGVTACGHCEYCRKSMCSHCTTGGWILGHRIDGTQAEFVRIPHADTSLYLVPPDVDEDALVMLSDVLPAGFECGVLNGKVQVGSCVAIVGAGPIGLAALLTAQLYAPADIIVIDLDYNRLAVAKRFGATATVNSTYGTAAQQVMRLTCGRGVNTAIEAVGSPAAFKLCQDIAAAGGTIANIGMHGTTVELHLERLWSHNVTITTGLVDTSSIPILLKTLQSGRIDVSQLVTHRFTLGEITQAYDIFEQAASTKALKIIIEMHISTMA